MAIGSVIQAGSFIRIKNEKGHEIGVISAGPKAVLVGYTATTVTVRNGSMTYVYNEKAHRIK